MQTRMRRNQLELDECTVFRYQTTTLPWQQIHTNDRVMIILLTEWYLCLTATHYSAPLMSLVNGRKELRVRLWAGIRLNVPRDSKKKV